MLNALIALFAVASLVATPPAHAQSPASTDTNPVVSEVGDLQPLIDSMRSTLAKSFVASAADLPRRDTRTVYINRENRTALSSANFHALPEAQREGFTSRDLDEQFYYFTRYGSPLHYAHTLDLIASIGLESAEQARIVDMGFGGIGHLRMLASLGAHVTGIEIDSVTRALYSAPDDTGMIARSDAGDEPGSLKLVYGEFPSEVADQIPEGLDLFLSRNTLKRGYIRPQREFRGSMDPLISLGASDQDFCQEVFDRLKPGGLFVIYNINPIEVAEGEQGWVPWSDGRFPFERELIEQIGFEVVKWNEVDPEGVDWLARISGDDLTETRESTWAVWTALRKPD